MNARQDFNYIVLKVCELMKYDPKDYISIAPIVSREIKAKRSTVLKWLNGMEIKREYFQRINYLADLIESGASIEDITIKREVKPVVEEKYVYDKKIDNRQKYLVHMMLLEEDINDRTYFERNRAANNNYNEKQKQARKEQNA